MNKIPVGRTIAQSYGFAFGRYLTVFGVTWLPLLAMAALTYYFRGSMHAAMAGAAHATGPFPFDPQFARINLLMQVVGLVLSAILSVGITKAALDLPRGPRFFYAGFGAAELRVIVGYFALVLLFIVFLIAFLIAAGILAGLSAVIATQIGAGAAQGIAAAIVGLAILVVWLALIFVFVRLTFLFLPATVVERRIGILRSWELTRGNFWRIFVIGFVVFLPVIIVGIAAGLAILGPGYLDFVMQHAKEPAVIQGYVMKRMELIYDNMPLLLAVGLFVNPILYALIMSPPAFAYRALVPPPDDTPMRAPEPEPSPEPEAKPESDLPPVLEEVLGPEKPEEH